MKLTVMTAAQRNGELVAHFARQGAGLREPEVMRIRRQSTAHEIRSACHRFDVISIVNAPRFWQRKDALVDSTVAETIA